jgi:prepilin-type processing-associated H-X9-DG protein
MQQAGWLFQILPYLEQDAVWRGGGAGSVAQCQINAMGATIKGYFCPSRRGPQAFSTGAWYGPGGTYNHAQTDYAGSSYDNVGAIVYCGTSGPTINLNAITDGTSNTLLGGDKRLNRALLGSFQGDDNEGYSSGWDHDTMRYTNVNYPPAPDSTSGDGGQRFGSSHPTGFNAVFCDGSVRMISYSIAPATFSYLGTRAGGEVIPNF